MASRVQVQDPTSSRRVAPSVRPVDSFVRSFREQPSRGPSGLAQLAGSLQGLAPALQKFAVRQDAAAQEEGTRQAQADRLKNKSNFADATRKGLIPPGVNPYYVQEYKRMDGELDAQGRYQGYLADKWQKSGLAEADFPTEAAASDAFMQFVEDTRGEFLGDGPLDPAYAEGFNKRRSGIESSAASHHVSARLKRNTEKFEANTSLLIGEQLDAGLGDEATGEAIAAIGRRQRAEFGVSNATFNELVIDQVVASAVNDAVEGDYNAAMLALDALDVIPTSEGNFLGKSGRAKEARNAAAIKITQIQQTAEGYAWSKTSRTWALEDRPATVAARKFQAESRDHTRKAWTDAEADDRESDVVDNAYMDTMMEIVANPEQDFSDTWARLSSKPYTAKLVPALQAALSARVTAGERVHEDEGQIAQLKLDIMRGEATPKTVVDMVANRTLSYAHSVDILEDWSRKDRAEAAMRGQNADVRRIADRGRAGLSKAITGSDEYSSPATSTLAFQAQLEYDDLFADFLTRNPNASLMDVRKTRADIVKLLLDDPQYSSERLGGTFDRPPISTPAEASATRAGPAPSPFNTPEMVQ